MNAFKAVRNTSNDVHHKTIENRMKKKITETDILQFLSKQSKHTFKAKALAYELGATKSQVMALKKSLKRLVADGKIYKYPKGQFGIAKQEPEVAGELRVKTQGYGFLIRDDGGDDIFVSQKNMGMALHKDRVKVRLLAKWVGDSPEGMVTEVIVRARTGIVGVYRKGKRTGFIVPDDLKIQRDIYVADEDAAGAKPGEKVVVEIVNWEHENLNPTGRIIEILGDPEAPGVDVLSIARSHNLPSTFPKRVDAEAAAISTTIPESEIKRRLDLRDDVLITIDPEDAKDFDDAVSLQILDDDTYQLGVHIADVSHYVQPGTNLDQEALERATSVYLVDRVIPMLPERLSNQICSLQPDTDRLAYTVLMELNSKGQILSHSFHESVIRSKRRFTYEEVQEVIEDRRQEPEFEQLIKNMHTLSQALIQKRKLNGSLEFDIPEARIILDSKGKPEDVFPSKRLDSHRLVEEFMLLANQTVALNYHGGKDDGAEENHPFVYRIHEKPNREKLNDFSIYVGALGYEFNPKKSVRPKALQSFLNGVEDDIERRFINQVMLRTLMKARYSTDNLGHFGLAFKHYTHFTSPIRRYPDLVVHRMLKQYQNSKTINNAPKTKTELEKICKQATEREIKALEAERESIKLKQVEFIATKLGQTYEGVISGVVAFGLFIEISKFLIEGLIHVRDLGSDYFIFNEKRFCLTGQSTGKIYRLGDPVTVQVARVNTEKKIVDFVLVEESAK